MIALYLLLAGVGIALTVIKPQTNSQSAEELMITGIIYAVLGVILFLVFAVALFLPRKPWNWIVGIVMMALGMTSCCFLPFLIPLLIYWLKPETKAYFGRN
jgi:Na+/pantothenate symporter